MPVRVVYPAPDFLTDITHKELAHHVPELSYGWDFTSAKEFAPYPVFHLDWRATREELLVVHAFPQ